MSTTPTTQAYYDRFAAGYEAERHHGYHRLIDELELDLVRRFGAGKDVFEAGCGTGLLLREAARVARTAVGLDLSRGMLEPARARGLSVLQGSLTDVPLPSETFDLVYSMKVLAHVPPIEAAVAELARLVRPGGHLCWSSTTHCRCATWPSASAALGRSPPMARPRRTSTRGSTPCRARAATFRRASI